MDLISNDSSTAELFIKDFSLVKNGTASIDSNNQVVFTPDSDFNGVAVVNYVACDTFGHCDNAEAYIFVTDSTYAAEDTVELFTVKNKPTTYLSPVEGFSIEQANNGLIEVKNNLAIIYEPDQDFTGIDSFEVSMDSLFHRLVIVNVFDLGQNNLFLKDDYAYTRMNQSTMLDVFSNDEPYLDLLSYTQVDTGTLVFDSTEYKFNYTPPLDYEGPVSFSYTSSNGFETESASVKILVKNIKPVTEYEYILEGIENIPLLIRYDVPTIGHTLSLWSDPEHGDVEVDEQGETFDEGCSPVTIQRELVYYPENNWTGIDSFIVAHCLDGECTEVLVKVKLNPEDGDCHCMSADCIWPGDANNDGVVNMLDLLTVGYYLGDITEGRDSIGTSWSANNPMSGIKDNEYADTDGNGIVAVFDTASISENYYKTHEIVPDVLPLSDYSVDLVPETTILDSGDLAVIHVELGDLDLPLYDVYGISFSLDFSEETIDSSTVEVEISANSWFLNFTRALDLTKVPWDGRVDVGFSRTNGVTADGYGLVSTLSFIVIDDIEGFRLRDDKLPINLKLTNVVVSHGDGSFSRLPDVEKTIYVKISDGQDPETTSVDPSKLYVYPNPSEIE
ncbi:MAG: Ig-like domain-containing protein, partial [Bacteroidota bacterium]